MEFENVVRKRRMVRNFQQRPVSPAIVDSILELALHAPSAGFSQGWAYVVITEAELKKKVGEIQGESDFYAHRFHKFISEAPALIVACASEKVYHDRYMEPDKVKDDGTEIEWPTPYWYFDIGGACMLIFLAAVEKGLATAFTGVFRIDQMRKLRKRSVNQPPNSAPIRPKASNPAIIQAPCMIWMCLTSNSRVGPQSKTAYRMV